MAVAALHRVRADELAPASAPAPEVIRRIERKLLSDPRRLPFLAAWLRTRCRKAAFATGSITTCYYDTRSLDAYYEAVDGDHSKAKVRIRWYDEPPSSGPAAIYLEVKRRDGAISVKDRLRLEVDGSALARGGIEAAVPPARLRGALTVLGFLSSHELVPVVFVSYHRQRFVEPSSGVGVSVDSGGWARMAPPWGVWPTVQLDLGVLELKGQRPELPRPLQGIDRLAGTWSSHSKYALALQALASRYPALADRIQL